MKAEKILGLHYITFCLLFYGFVLLITCSCSSRKTNLELAKTNTSQSSELKIDLKEATLDKGIIEKLSSDNSYTIVIKEYFGQLADSSHISVNYPIFRETTFIKSDKKTSEKENKDLNVNKALQANEKKKEASVSKVKNKQVENTGIGTGKAIGITFIVCVVGAALFFAIRQVKG